MLRKKKGALQLWLGSGFLFHLYVAISWQRAGSRQGTGEHLATAGRDMRRRSVGELAAQGDVKAAFMQFDTGELRQLAPRCGQWGATRLGPTNLWPRDQRDASQTA